MGNNALMLAVIWAVAVFLIVIALASIGYDKERLRTKNTKRNSNDWLFHDFYLKVYSALFGYSDPDEIAVKIGIKIEKYYKSCALVKTEPNTKKLIVFHIYGFGVLILSAVIAVIWNIVVIIPGMLIFIAFVYFEQHTLDKKAEAMRIEIANDLPRYLDLLQTELQVGLPIETAIQILSCRYDCLLSREFLAALNEMELGAGGWQQALEKVAQKYDVETLSNFVLDITTSYDKGVSISDAVSRKAKDIKATHLLNIKERAGKTTNTILIPIAVFQFCPLLAFLLIPALVQVIGGF